MSDGAVSDGAIVVVGAGIGGLAAAIGLALVGRRVVVVERSPTLSTVGAGIQLSPNAVRCLDRLGVLSRLRPQAVAPAALALRSVRHGGTVAEVPLGEAVAQRFGAPYLVAHRADLQAALLARAEQLAAIELRLGVRAGTFVEHARGITVSAFAGEKDATAIDVRGTALVVADGVWSELRTGGFGGPAVRFLGRTAYRATLPADGAPSDTRDQVGLWMAPGAHLVHYPVRGGREINLVAVMAERDPVDGWAHRADPATLRASFASWPEPARGLIAAAGAWSRWALAEVPSGGAWVRGRAGLLGDAAHAMPPFAAQGAAQALEDAVVLATEIGRRDDAAPALAAYEAARRGRVARVMGLARANGRLYHLGGLAAGLRDRVLAARSAASLAERQAWVWAWRPPGVA